MRKRESKSSDRKHTTIRIGLPSWGSLIHTAYAHSTYTNPYPDFLSPEQVRGTREYSTPPSCKHSSQEGTRYSPPSLHAQCAISCSNDKIAGARASLDDPRYVYSCKSITRFSFHNGRFLSDNDRAIHPPQTLLLHLTIPLPCPVEVQVKQVLFIHFHSHSSPNCMLRWNFNQQDLLSPYNSLLARPTCFDFST